MVAPPIILSFSIKEQEKYLLFQDAFAALGFQIEEFGAGEYCIRAVRPIFSTQPAGSVY